MSFHDDWINLLVDFCIAKNQQLIQSDLGKPLSLNVIDSILAGGVLIRAMSLLDEALEDYIDKNRIEIKSKFPKLFNRLQILNELGKLVDILLRYAPQNPAYARRYQMTPLGRLLPLTEGSRTTAFPDSSHLNPSL